MRAAPTATPRAGGWPDPTPLLLRMGKGDDAAGNEFARIFRPLVLAYMRRRLSDPDQAEDATQETLMCCWQRAATFRAMHDQHGAHWVASIARVKVLHGWSATRRRDRRERDLEDAGAVAAPTPTPTEDHDAETLAQLGRVLWLLPRLTPERRELLARALFGGERFRRHQSTRVKEAVARLRQLLPSASDAPTLPDVPHPDEVLEACRRGVSAHPLADDLARLTPPQVLARYVATVSKAGLAPRAERELGIAQSPRVRRPRTDHLSPVLVRCADVLRQVERGTLRLSRFRREVRASRGAARAA